MKTLDELDAIHERIRLAPVALIGARIRRARRECGFSHDYLGELIRPERPISRQHLIKLEKAKHRPRPWLLTRIAEVTDRPIDFFLDEEAVDNPFPEAA